MGDWNAKAGSPETLGVTGKFGLGVQNNAGKTLIELCQENALVIANTLFQKHKRRLYTQMSRWSPQKSDSLHPKSILRSLCAGQEATVFDYTLCIQRWKSTIQSAKTRPGAKLTAAQIMNSLLPNSDLS